METLNSVESASTGPKRSGVLYPLMVFAAIAVIVFSVVGIATVMGWMPRAVSGAAPVERVAVVPAAQPGASRSAPMASSGPACSDCGVIESVRAIEAKGEGSGIGAIGGAVVGGILGNQVGRGGGRAAATVIGAGAGAYAGNEIEKTAKRSVIYEIRVRMNDGTTRTFHEPAPPALAVGQKVRITDRGIVG